MGDFSAGAGLATLETLARRRDGHRARISSWDRTGGNDDRLHIAPGENRRIAGIAGAGCITHVWCTLANEGFVREENQLRKVVLRAFWDGETSPSVEAPIGDFFGMGHAMSRNFVSAPLQMSPQDGKGFNCWFPMPFASGARLEVLNECDSTLLFYYYVDFEAWPSIPPDQLRFHAQWRRECPTDGTPDEGVDNREWCFGGSNATGEGNYLLLDARGLGHYVGCNVNIHNLRASARWDWPGEGDDMIFIDGEPWPPRLHGTGTEDYVNMSWCPTQEYSAPYHGLILGGQDNWKGKITYYRYHIQDPVMFTKSIKVTIEHGHANHRSDDWSSTAYWYQDEPHAPFPTLPPVARRLPVKEDELLWGGKPPGP